MSALRNSPFWKLQHLGFKASSFPKSSPSQILTQDPRMERARSFLLSILFSFFLARPRMTEKAGKRKQRVVIVGGGVTGSLLARELSSKLDQEEHELLLVEARPYVIWLIAGARLATEEGHHPGLEERAFVPYDKLFYEGNGSVKQGKVVAIQCYPRSASTDARSNDPGAGKSTENDYSGCIVLEDRGKVLYDVLVLATGSKHAGPVDFPDDPVQCLAHLQHWRTTFRKAKDVMLVGGGGVAIGGRFRDAMGTFC
jgi:hypothetical protein